MNLRKTQLRTRVMIGVLAVTLTALAGFGYVAVTVVHGYLLTSTDTNLKTVLGEEYEPMIGMAHAPHGVLQQPKGGQSSGPKKLHTGIVTIPAFLDVYRVQFKTTNGRWMDVVQGNSDLVPRLPDDLAALAAGHGSQTVTSVNGHTMLRLMAVSGPGGTLVVTISLDSVNATTGRVTTITVVGMLVAALVVFAGVGLVVRRGLRPVETMAATADKITAGDLTIRVDPDEPGTEVGRLGAAINGMLARIQAAVDEREADEQAIRQFFADASHELRTPLASLRANAELYQQGALHRRTQVDAAMHRIAAEARRMGILVDDMLRLARLDQHPGRDRKPVDLTALIAESAERARIASPERTWNARVSPGLVTNGDEELLRRVIDNLLANVITHTPPGTTAEVLGTAGEDAITVEVRDDGPGVEASKLPRIFDRFYRASAQPPTPGSGLGLAIVAAVVAGHDGSVEAALNHPQGLRIVFRLPLADPATPRWPPMPVPASRA